MVDPSEVETSETINLLLQPLIDLIIKISNLKCLTWNVGPIFVALLNILQKFHPDATLRIFKFVRFDAARDSLSPSELQLARFGNLTHFRMTNWPEFKNQLSTYEGHRFDWATLKAIVVRCQNLEYLGVIGLRSLQNTRCKQNLENRPLPNRSSPKDITLDSNDLCLSENVLSNSSIS